MAWPNDPCPPNGPTAKAHLDYIRSKAQQRLSTTDPATWARIRDAVDACKAAHCRRHDFQEGTPPPDAEHCQRVLWARCHADESNWSLCADELEHGT